MTTAAPKTANDTRAGARTDRFDSPRRTPASAGGGLRLDERVTLLTSRLEARADLKQAAALRADVREARGHVKDWEPSKSVSAGTAERYIRTAERMRAQGVEPDRAACRSTFEFQRAALIHTTRTELKHDLRELDKCKKSGDLNRAAEAYNRVRAGLDTLRKYPPSTGSRAADLARTSAYRGPAQSDNSNGKRSSLEGLPSDWRDRLQREAPEQDKAAFAALSLSGCRPAEVKGIKVRQDEQVVRIEIKGAKFDVDRGVKSRTLDFDKAELNQTQAGRDLQEWLGARGCRTVTHSSSVEAFRERVGRAADRAGLEGVSAYSMRHAAAADLREAGANPSEIGDRLGHRSARSQAAYG